jgi:hypothetical protein
MMQQRKKHPTEMEKKRRSRFQCSPNPHFSTIVERFVAGQRSNSIDTGAVGLLGIDDDTNVEEMTFGVAPSDWYVTSATTRPQTGEKKSFVATPKLGKGARRRSLYIPKPKLRARKTSDARDESPTVISKGRRRNSIRTKNDSDLSQAAAFPSQANRRGSVS